MSSVIRPLSIRDRVSSAPGEVRGAVAAQSSAIALACIAASVAGQAFAQGSPQPVVGGTTTSQAPLPSGPAQPVAAGAQSPAGQGSLPALKVEAAKPKPAVQKPQPVTAAPRTSPAPVAKADPSPPPTQAPVPQPSSAVPPGGNPYADPNAPYKVDRSSSAKLTEPLLDTPRTVTAISKEVIEAKQATSLKELLRTTPGISLGVGEGGNAFGDVLFIRGFKATSDTYINGVRDTSVTVRENFNTEQVEILKGPGSSVNGRGTTGGAVNVVTKMPQDVNFGVVSTTVGTDHTTRVTADVNQAVDKFAIRANGMWQEANVAGRDTVYDDRWGGAIAATWKPISDFRLTFDYSRLRIDSIPDWGVPWDAVNKRPFSESGVPRTTFYGVANRDFTKGQQDIATMTVETKLAEGITLTSKLRKGDTLIAYVASAPERPTITNPDPNLWTVVSAPKSRHQTNDIVANQTDVKMEFATGPIKHTLVVGAELSKEEVSRDTYRALDTESFTTGAIAGCTVNLFNPVTGPCWDSRDELRLAGNPTVIGITTKALYILDTIKFSPQWILNVGARVDDYEINAKSNLASANPTVLARQDTMINWNAGITYKPVPIASIYAAAGTSTNPTGQELDAGADDYGGITARSVLLSPEKNTAYEVGTKWELFGRRLLATAAAFQTTKENARETVSGQLLDSGEYRIRGVEFGLSGNVTRALSLYGGAVFMDSEITKSLIAANKGADFANIAHNTFNLLAKYKVTETISVGGQATYASEIKGGTFAATTGNTLPDHWRFDLMGEWKVAKMLDISFNIINVTNELYYDGFYRSAAPYVYVAPGRAAYLTAKVKY